VYTNCLDLPAAKDFRIGAYVHNQTLHIQKEVNLKKSISAFIAAVLVTGLLAGVMVLVGQDALGTSTAKAVAAAADTAVPADAVAQYEQIVAQYQSREARYQAQIDQASQQIDTADQRIQQYQSLLEQLQSSGLITIAVDGSVTINQQSQAGFFPQSEHHGGSH
jgi:predicted PurR-regulated permease PerM